MSDIYECFNSQSVQLLIDQNQRYDQFFIIRGLNILRRVKVHFSVFNSWCLRPSILAYLLFLLCVCVNGSWIDKIILCRNERWIDESSYLLKQKLDWWKRSSLAPQMSRHCMGFSVDQIQVGLTKRILAK